MVSATHPAFKGGSAARSAARRRNDTAWSAARRRPSPIARRGRAPQGAHVGRRAALHSLTGNGEEREGKSGAPGADQTTRVSSRALPPRAPERGRKQCASFGRALSVTRRNGRRTRRRPPTPPDDQFSAAILPVATARTLPLSRSMR
jgi:hypothetical protein